NATKKNSTKWPSATTLASTVTQAGY
ncbi:nusB family protein, partial [Vibrio parahaemolyticus V-223/04]